MVKNNIDRIADLEKEVRDLKERVKLNHEYYSNHLRLHKDSQIQAQENEK